MSTARHRLKIKHVTPPVQATDEKKKHTTTKVQIHNVFNEIAPVSKLDLLDVFCVQNPRDLQRYFSHKQRGTKQYIQATG